MSLQEFIETNHVKLLAMTREKVAKRSKNPRSKEEPKQRSEELETKHGVHVFLKEMCKALTVEGRRDPGQHADADPPTSSDIADTAALHGHDLLGLGFSIDEVVHDYGDVCQAVTELAVDLDATVTVAEFHTLNRCLDNAIASAVTTWTGEREKDASAEEGKRDSEDEKLKRLVGSSINIFEQIRTGRVGTGGASALVLGTNLEKMRAMLEASKPSPISSAK